MGKGLGLMVTPVAAGVRTDLETLFARFKERGELSYDTFESVWLEMRLTNIFRMRDSEAEMRELIERIFYLALGYALESQDPFVQCCALAAVYGFYHTQPQKSLTRIPLTLDKLQRLKHLMAELKNRGDVEFLFLAHSLLKDRAFHLFVFDQEYNPLTHKAYDNTADSLNAEEQAAAFTGTMETDVVGDLLKHNAVAELGETHLFYTAEKDRLLKEMPLEEGLKSLSLVKNNLLSYLSEVAEDTEAKINKRLARYPNTARDKAREAEEEEEHTVQSRRSQLKAKAFSGLASQARHRRHRQEEGASGSLAKELNFEHDPVADILAAFAVPTAPAPVKKGTRKKAAKKEAEPKTEKKEGEEEEPEVVAPPKIRKKPGPKPKRKSTEPEQGIASMAVIDICADGAEEAGLEAAVVKKKRGRPRQNPTDASPKEKKPRGRPRLEAKAAAHALEEV